MLLKEYCMLYLIPFLVALLSVSWIHPKLVAIALDKNIVDNPDARKLQKKPVPVLGGIAVFFGAVVGLGVTSIYWDCTELFVVMTAMAIMLYIGCLDDILNLSPIFRFCVEIGAVLLLIFAGGYCLDDFHGLWGIEAIGMAVAVPLTVFATVGIINAINLIDGVDGLSSGYCVMASILFGVMFGLAGDRVMTLLAVVAAGALIPFFFHNVFGLKSKMFIGDSGTLGMGIIISVFVLRVLRHESFCCSAFPEQVGLIPFTLAVLAVPVFDTLRVMTTRIMHHKSPFHPDKTHLHHMFIRLGISHAATTVAILTLNFIVVLCWWIASMCGCSVDVQLYIVVILGVAITFGLYNFLGWHLQRGTRLIIWIRWLARKTHLNRSGVFLWLQKAMDSM